MLLSVHRTTVQGSTVPWTVTVNAGLPAAAEVCASELMVGAGRLVVGVESVKGSEFETPTELVAVTLAVPGKPASVAEMEAVS